MADKNKLRIEVIAKTTKAQVGFKKLGKDIDNVRKKTDKTEKSFGRLRVKTEGIRRGLGVLRNNLLLVSFAFGGTAIAIGKLLAAYGEQELAEKKLSTALGFTSQALLEQASALQEQTTFGDEAIIGVQALIAAFTDDEEQIKALTKATLDLSAAKGMELTAAADLVSKSFGSATNALSRYGITVEGAVGSTERLEMLTGNVADLFGGQAQAQAQTYTGSIKQMRNSMGDTAESVGELLAPAIIRLSSGFKRGAEAVRDFLDSLKEVPEEEMLVSENVVDLNLEIFNQAKLMTELRRKKSFFWTEDIINTQKALDVHSAYVKKLEERRDFVFTATDEELEKDRELREAKNEDFEALEFRRGKTLDFHKLEKKDVTDIDGLNKKINDDRRDREEKARKK